MGPLSVVALVVALFLVGITWIGWIAASVVFLGWVLFIVALIILIDFFWGHREVIGTRVRRRTVVTQ